MPTPQIFADLVGKKLSEISMAVVPNSKDYYAERARSIGIKSFVDDFASLDIQADVVDLRDFNDPVMLKNKLSQYDAVWACGGNTFCLRYEMRRSGFDQIINDLMDDGLVFCGDSAGAIVAGPTLKGSETADKPEFAEEIIWDGLNLIPDFIMPHVNSEVFKDTLAIVRSINANNPHYIELNDWEAVVYDDETRTIVSSKRS